MAEPKIQKIRYPHFSRVPDLQLDPRDGDTINVVGHCQRTLSHVVGIDRGQVNTGQVLINNALSVSQKGASFTSYGVASGTAPDTHGVAGRINAATYFYRVDILVETYDAKVNFRKDDRVSYGAEIILKPGNYSIDFTCTGVSIIAENAGSNPAYQIVGWT